MLAGPAADQNPRTLTVESRCSCQDTRTLTVAAHNTHTRTPPRSVALTTLRQANRILGPVVPVAIGAEPITLLELHGRAMVVVARFAKLVVVVATNRALPIAVFPLLFTCRLDQ